MALAFDRDRIMYDADRDAVCFLANHESRLIRCLVPRSVLTEVVGFRQAAPRHLVAMFRRHRRIFLELADRKYQRGDLERDGSVRLGLDDLDGPTIARSLRANATAFFYLKHPRRRDH
jgi:uncharacterized protein DUF1488